jgi:para-aminobenzoate synthetase/4-amino-4-deoxychorismate lyase
MTSTIEARLRPGAGMPELLQALFPCGSVTGAPKHHTMELIARLETTPRRLYTGCIGWVDAGGDFCASVAIRTLLLGPQAADGTRDAELGVGGGIVLDSDPAAEHDETQVKARFATALDPGFRLFETLRVAGTRRVAQLDAHLARLQASARRHRFACDTEALRARLVDAAAGAAGDGPWRLRLALAHDGRSELTLAPLPRIARPVRFQLAEAALPAHERALAADKTTARASYDAAIRAAEAAGAFDVVFVDADGRLSEGARSSVFLRLDGRWCTPPLTGPVLPGTRRARLLRRLHAAERPLTPADLARADRVLLCNALRGALPAMHAGSYRPQP